MDYFAHTLSDDISHWEPLAKHLQDVSILAEAFATEFESGEWGKLAGLWHDLGKYREAFQRRLRGEPIAAEHAIVGALHAQMRFGPRGGLLAAVIAGHHAGLANRSPTDSACRTPLETRLARAGAVYEEACDAFPPDIAGQVQPAFPPFLLRKYDTKEIAQRRGAFWTRMLFSALVDADYLATEAFVDAHRAGSRTSYASIAELKTRLDRHLSRFSNEAASPLNAARSEILGRCRASAPQSPGLFTLTVPTGGGKTLSGMAFALDHALAHDLRRVIVVLPYTSIIEQNAQVYREVFGAENVLEHHGNLSIEDFRKEHGEEITARHMLAEENWDTPIVVTTSVQFLESLHASKTSRCRKLHNIAGSVVILDEVQTLPKDLLCAILDSFNALLEGYRCSLVLSTATPPALQRRASLEQGLPVATAIIAEPPQLFRRLNRVRYHWPDPDAAPVEWPALAATLAAHRQVLAIVDTRKAARVLAEELAAQTGEAVFHLSARMCPAHRLAVISRIRAVLKDDEPCRVVSTQLIEAGVDLDFPVVYRAFAGLDRIVQAAGRCNREGRKNFGNVYIFSAPPSMAGDLRTAADVTRSMLTTGSPDVTDPAVFDEYFRNYYGSLTDERFAKLQKSKLGMHTYRLL